MLITCPKAWTSLCVNIKTQQAYSVYLSIYFISSLSHTDKLLSTQKIHLLGLRYLSAWWSSALGKTEVVNAVQSRKWCELFPSVTFHYLEGCRQPAWPHPRFYRGADRGRGLSWFVGRQDIYTEKEKITSDNLTDLLIRILIIFINTTLHSSVKTHKE